MSDEKTEGQYRILSKFMVKGEIDKFVKDMNDESNNQKEMLNRGS